MAAAPEAPTKALPHSSLPKSSSFLLNESNKGLKRGTVILP